MDLTPQEFEDVIGAYALDACDSDETAAIEVYVAQHPEAAREVERLREAAAALGSVGALRPPLALRDRLMTAVSDRTETATARETLEIETRRFEELLASIDDDALSFATENGLTVQELVAHVEAIDRAFVAEADEPHFGFIGANEVEAITADALPRYAGESFAETVTRFRRTRAELVRLADRVPESQRLGGYRRDDTLVVRAFETWTHGDDIRRAIGQTNSPPAAPVMHRMAELAMHSMPLAMAARGTDRSARTARVVMTGPGGGAWTIACGPAGEPGSTPDVEIEVSVVDFCRRFADRIEPDALPMIVAGDEQLARELVAAANSFAGL